MAITLTWPSTAGVQAIPTAYSIPQAGNVNWANLTNFLQALGQSAQATTFQLFATRVATTTPISFALSDCIVQSNLSIAGAVAITLVAGTDKQIAIISDGKGDAGTNNITITPAMGQTIGGASTYIINRAYGAVMLAFNSSATDWRIVGRWNPFPQGGDIGGFADNAAIISSSTGYLEAVTGSQYQSLVMGASAPGFGAINLGQSAAITGTLPIGNGGTSVTSVTTIPTASSFAGWDVNENLSANSFIDGYATTTTAASTTTLTVASAQNQYFTGTTTQIVKMPVTSTLALGQSFYIVNNSTGAVTVESSGSNTIQILASGTVALFTCILTSGTTAASWNTQYSFAGGGILPVSLGGTGLSSGTSGGILGFTASGTLASSVALTASQLVIGGGAGATPTVLAAGSQYQVLVMGASNPGYGAVALNQSGSVSGSLPIGNGGTGTTTAALAFAALSPLTTEGDIIYENATPAPARLAIGTTGQILTVSGGLPTWSTPSYASAITSLTGDVTASGPGAAAATLAATTNSTLTTLSGLTTAANLVTVGSISSGTWGGTTIAVAHGGTAKTSVTTAPAATSWAGWDTNSNLSANNHIEGYTTTAASSTTITLTVSSTYQQYITGTTTQLITLPVASTLVVGFQFQIVNATNSTVTVQSSGANTVQAMTEGTTAYYTCILASGTSAASWSVTYISSSGAGTVTSVAMTVPTFLSISGSPVTASGTLALSVASGNSGGILGYTGTNTLASSAALTVSQLVIGGGAGATPTTLTGPSSGQYLQGNGSGIPAWYTIPSPTVQAFTAFIYFTFTVSSANATAGATYTNNGATYTVIYTIASGTTLVCSCTTNTSLSGTTLTKASGTGDATITESARTSIGTYYPTSTAVKWLRIIAAAGGAGGWGSGSAAGTTPGAGTNTTFGTSFIVCNGGNYAASFGQATGGVGGTATLSSGAYGQAVQGGNGGGTGYDNTVGIILPGAPGGANPLGGAGAPGNAAGAGTANTGAGGAGGSTQDLTGQDNGAGGGAGGYVDCIVNGSLSSTYTFGVGVGGAAGGAGTGGVAGAAGANGCLYVFEYYV